MNKKHYSLVVAIGIAGLFAPSALAADLFLEPVGATGTHTINGNLILLDSAGQTVTLEIRLDDWNPQGDIGVCNDLTLCSVSAQDCEVGPCQQSNGLLNIYQVTIDASSYQGVLMPILLPEEEMIDATHPEWVFAGVQSIRAVDTSTEDWRYGAVVLNPNQSRPYLGVDKYGGTLAIDVPVGTVGTYTISLVEGPNASFMGDSNSVPIVPINLAPAIIAIACQTSQDCDDGNACTDDICNPNNICSNPINYNDTLFCCNPADGTLTPLDDGNECTNGVCDPATGNVTQFPRPAGTLCGNPPQFECDAQDVCNLVGQCVNEFQDAGTACGDPTDTECDNPDTCNATGVCQDNLESPGTACGDPTNTECDGADTCNASGTCITNIAPSGTACGDPSDTDCNNPDTCNGAGACLPNLAPPGLPCGNPIGNQCDNPDTCDANGLCQPNFIPAGTACGNPADTECDNPDSCDGAGACSPNREPDGTQCTDDGNQCRDDVCLTGVCSHPFSSPGTICGDPTETECNHADTCNGTGTCLTNLEPSGAACGDPTDTDCDRADTCNGAGSCLANIQPTGTACGDPTDTACDNPDTCNGAGTCLPNVAPAGLPCGNPVGNQCDNPDSCDGAGGCQPNFVPVGTACGNPNDTECDNPDQCNGAGTCSPNHEPNGSACADDGNPCRDDVCAAGACTHPLSAQGTPCGDPTDTECNGADSCDGLGSCLPNLAPAGTACGDGTDTECTDPDTCSGLGNCQPNNAANGIACGQGSFCVTGATCLGGDCAGGNPRDCDDGLPCTDDSCNESLEECENVLIEGNCLIDDACYAMDELNPANDCEICDTTLSTTDWTLLPIGEPCNDGDVCTFDDVCDEAGQCGGTVDTACNDDCINAVEVFDGSNVSNNENRGPDDDEATCQFDSDNDVWFFYVASCDGLVRVDTIGSVFTPSNDTVLSAYDEDPAPCEGAEIACDDDAGPGLLSLLQFNATADESYRIRVAGFMDNAGDIVLNITTLDSCVIDDLCVPAGAANPLNECEACIPLLSSIDWSPKAAGSACGAPGGSQCDSADSCDGNGVCEVNHKPNGTTCGDDGNDCTNDVCNTGACTHPFKAAGAACGDPAATECDSPDTCDGAGACLPNNLPSGVACGDPSTSECDNADVCDGSGGCNPNHQPNGLSCSDDGNDCTADECSAGLCTHPDLATGTACGDAADTPCDNPDTCDGAGMCLSNFEPSGVACGNPGDTECDNPDTCNGAGTCVTNFEPTGTACGDPTDTDCDNPDTCNGSGACLPRLEVTGFPCGDPSNTQCDNPDTCNGAGVCLDNFEPPGLACGDSSSSECDNADSCDGAGLCLVNHQGDGLPCSDEGNECTDDVCDTGLCAHPPKAPGAACGDAGDSQCDNPDSCDGAGTCLDNYEPSGFACGSPGDTDCDNPDSCNGTGLCLTNFEPTGTSCGDPADTDCDNPDTCNGSGTCLANLEITGFPCGDPSNTQCDNPDTCDGTGICLDNFEPPGLACGDPTSSQCDNPDQCNGDGACSPNHVPDGTACAPDANDCTDDVCTTGACTHPFELPDTPCGDGSDTECDDPDTCDGGGVCLDNFEPSGTPCGDPSSDQCDNPDICNGAGACDPNFVMSGTPCDDDDLCSGNDVCNLGDCAGTGVAQTPNVVLPTPGVCSRRFRVTPLPAGAPGPVALLVTSPDWTCLNKYIDLDGSLTDTPVFQLIDDWGTVLVKDELVVPSSGTAPSRYRVQAECGEFLSNSGQVTMGLWADIDGSGDVSFLDISLVVKGFQNDFSEAAFECVDIWPCTPDDDVNFADISVTVRAFQAQTYAQTGCPVPCP